MAAFIMASRVHAQPALANDVAALVNDVVITRLEVLQAVAPGEEVLRRQFLADKPDVYAQRLLALQQEQIEELINRQLILFDFTNSGYNLPESIIEDDIQARIRQDYGDRATLIKTLRGRGITYETYRQDVRDGIIINALIKKNIAEEIQISPFKIERFYETNKTQFQLDDRVKLRAIVLNKSPDSPDSAKKLAQDILRKLDAGVSFVEMATIHSEGSQRAQGGDWGWMEKKELKNELVDIAFKLKPGEKSSVIETTDACYILLVEEVSTSHVRSLAEVREQIEKVLVNQERNRLKKQWLDRLRKKCFVKNVYRGDG